MDYHNQYSGYTEAITLEIEQLAKYMFVENTDKLIGLDIHGIGDTKDMFCFCLDLFCKGIVFVCGENGRADIESMTGEQYQTIAKKMLYAGIKCHTEFTPIEKDMSLEDIRKLLHTSIHAVHLAPGNLQLKDYCFQIKLGESICTISFEIVRI